MSLGPMLWASLRCQSTWIIRTQFRAQPLRIYPKNNLSRTLFRTARHRNAIQLTSTPPQPLEGPTAIVKSAENINTESFAERVGKPTARNQIWFFVFGTFFILSNAATSTQLETDRWILRVKSPSEEWNITNITTATIVRAREIELLMKLKAMNDKLKEAVSELTPTIKKLVLASYVYMAQSYLDMTEGRRLTCKIVILNTIIWTAWQFRRLEPAITRAFLHSPLSGKSITLLTSIFGHRSFMHLLLTSLALDGFGPFAASCMEYDQNRASTLESTRRYELMALIMSAGIFSGMVSHIVMSKIRYPRIVSQMTSPTAVSKRFDTWAAALASASAPAKTVAKKSVLDVVPTLGTGGAAYALMTYSALSMPDASIAVFFPPTHPLNIQTFVGGLVAVDVIGLLRGWNFGAWNHWAHLSGAAFGALYYVCRFSLWHFFKPPPQNFNARPKNKPEPPAEEGA